MDTERAELIERVKQEIKRKRDSTVAAAIAAADAEAKKAYEALNVVLSLLNGESRGLMETAVAAETLEPFILGNEGNAPAERRAYPTAKWVGEIIADMNGSVISQPVIYDKLVERHPEVANRGATSVKSQVSAILKKMTANGKLTVDKESHGGAPAEYRKSGFGDAVRQRGSE